MRVLLVAEGKHELGDGEDPGALEVLVRRLLDRDDVSIECRRVADPRVHAYHGRGGKGHFKRALRWLREAHRGGFNALVLVIDEDGRRETKAEIDEAQQTQLDPTPRALGVAIRSFDAWMLADESALATVLGGHIPRQRHPENLSEPKLICARLRDASSSTLDQHAMYAAIAAECNLILLTQRCPAGFGAFAERARTLGGES